MRRDGSLIILIVIVFAVDAALLAAILGILSTIALARIITRGRR